MERERVESSNLHSIGWEGNTLEVQFRSGAVYQYADVPADIHLAFMQTESKGAFLHHVIKPTYAVTRMPDEMLTPAPEPDGEPAENDESTIVDSTLTVKRVAIRGSAFTVVRHQRRD